MPSISVPTALAIGGAALSAGGAIAGGISQGHALGYQAQVARNNADIAKQNAEYASQAGDVATQRTGLKARSQLNTVRASLAANGLDVNSGSAADTQVSQREIGALDQATTAHDAALQIYGYKTQAQGYTDQSKLLNSEASDAVAEGVLKGAGSLLGAASQLPDAFSWMSASDVGSGISAAADTVG